MTFKAEMLMLFACAALIMPVAAGDEDAAKQFLGTWILEMDFGGRIVNPTLEISRNDDGKLAGKWESPRGASDLQDVKVADGQLSFMRKMNRQGMDIEIISSAKIVEGKLSGKMETPMGEMIFSGKRPESEDEAAAAPAARPALTAAGMLSAMDADGDGLVQESEASEGLKSYFGMLDTDADGGLSEAELETVVQYRSQQGN